MRDTVHSYRIPVWDAPVRLFHWLLVVLMAGLWITGELGKLDLHFILGKSVLALVLFRIAWGIVGSNTARFSQFVRGPRAVLAYLRHPVPVLGHNPLGALSVLALLILTLIQGSTGLFTSDDIITDGPLAHLVSGGAVKLLSTAHRVGFNVLLALVAVHVGAIVFYRVVKHDNLVLPMIVGTRTASSGIPCNSGGNAVVALGLVAAAATLVWGGIAMLAP